MLCTLFILYTFCNREQRLQDALHLHEFKRESSELEDWISQEQLVASSDDYGSDYEHVLVRYFASELKRKWQMVLKFTKTHQKLNHQDQLNLCILLQ